MPGRIRVGIEADEAMLAAQILAPCSLCRVRAHSVSDGMINGRNQIAEDAMRIARPRGKGCGYPGAGRTICRGDVSITPRSKKVVHRRLGLLRLRLLSF